MLGALFELVRGDRAAPPPRSSAFDSATTNRASAPRRWHRERTWCAIISVGWAIAAVQLLTLSWVPDCGGVSYGVPLRYLQSWMASSCTFDLYVIPFLVDVLIVASLLALPTWIVVRRIARCPRRTRGAARGLLLTPWLILLALGPVLAAGEYHLVWSFSNQESYVAQWRSVRPYGGPPTWDKHLETECN